jgi:hypothetical protein
MRLVKFRRESSVPITINCIPILYNVLNCIEFIEVIDPPSSYVATFFNFHFNVFKTYATYCTARRCNYVNYK